MIFCIKLKLFLSPFNRSFTDSILTDVQFSAKSVDGTDSCLVECHAALLKRKIPPCGKSVPHSVPQQQAMFWLFSWRISTLVNKTLRIFWSNFFLPIIHWLLPHSARYHILLQYNVFVEMEKKTSHCVLLLVVKWMFGNKYVHCVCLWKRGYQEQL